MKWVKEMQSEWTCEKPMEEVKEKVTLIAEKNVIGREDIAGIRTFWVLRLRR